MATDNHGKTEDYDVVVTVTDVNERPELTGSPVATVSYDENVTMDVAAYTARDEESAMNTWSLTGPDRGRFSISTEGVVTFDPNTFADGPNYEDAKDSGGDNVYDFTVVVTDTQSGSSRRTASIDVAVTVEDVEEPGTITVSNLNPAVGETVTFTLEDPDGGIVSARWLIQRRPTESDPWVQLGTARNDPPGSTSYAADEDQTGRQVRAIVTSYEDRRGPGKKAESEPTAAITADPIVNAPPRFRSYGIPPITEGTAGDVGERLRATDRDNDTLTFGIQEGDGSEYFAINSATGQTRTTQALDFESTLGFLEFTVTLHDGRDADGNPSTEVDVTKDFVIFVIDVEEPGVVTLPAEEPEVGTPLQATLADGDGNVSGSRWRWARSANGQTGWTNISGATSSTYTPKEEDGNFYLRASVTYTDRRGGGKSAEAVTSGPVPSKNRPPTFPSTENGARTVAENTRAGESIGDPVAAEDPENDTLVYTLVGADAAAFTIVENTGQLRTSETLDFEMQPSYTFTVEVHDGRDDSGSPSTTIDDTQAVTITIENVEEPGTVTLTTDTATIQARVEVTAELIDGDGPSGIDWQWSRSPNGMTGWVNISNARSARYTPTLGEDAGNYIRATATYTDGHGSNSKTANAVSPRVGDPPLVNSAPAFPSTENGQRTVAENTRAGVNIGDPVAAEDPENDTLVYTLVGVDAAAFTIVENTGQLRTKEALNFETKRSYSVTVEVHDGRDSLGQPSTTGDDTQSVTITVENVEEPGTVTLSTATATIQARVEVTAELIDGDGPSGIDWQWSRSPNGMTGWVNISNARSAMYTPTLGEDAGNYIRATATYTDGHGSNSKTANAVSPRVGDPPLVNSAPAFPSTENGQREVAEDASGNIGDAVVATDFNNGTLYYSLSGTDAASFEIGQNNGQLRLASGVMLDFEGKRSYRFTVEVSDRTDQNGVPDMVIDDRQNVTITLTNVNEAPKITGDAAPAVDENSHSALASYTGDDPERDTLTWSVSGNDFWISDRGQLYFATPPSYESGRTPYTVTITAADDDATPLSGSLTVTVTVTDVEEEGTVTVTPPRGWDGTAFTADLTDGDGGISGVTWTWARSSNRSSWTDIPTASSESYTATPDDIGNYLRASVTYSDRRGSNKTALAVLTVRVGADRPTTNIDPEFADTTVTRDVGQGTAAGRSVGAPLRAVDKDTDDVLTYALQASPDADKFDIDPATGQLRTKAVLDYDPEGQNEYTVVVEVHDGYGPTYLLPSPNVDDTIEVTITVTAVSRVITERDGGGGGGFGPALVAPQFIDGFRTSRPLAVTARAGDAVGDPVAATHPRNADVTYSLSGADAARFTVDEETGQIRLGQARTLALGQTYTVNLTATDNSGTGSIIIVVIEVAEGVGDPYDLNRNGSIEKDEVLEAVADYIADLIEKDEVLALVARYFAGDA